MDYRLISSSHIPALTVIETIVPPVENVTLVLESPGCGEEIPSDGRKIFYGLGDGSAYSGDDLGTWYVCASNGPGGRAAHAAFFAHENIIVEIKAFPESGISKDDIIRIASSISFDE